MGGDVVSAEIYRTHAGAADRPTLSESAKTLKIHAVVVELNSKALAQALRLG
jgi:hypothetical protein